VVAQPCCSLPLHAAADVPRILEILVHGPGGGHSGIRDSIDLVIDTPETVVFSFQGNIARDSLIGISSRIAGDILRP